MQKIEEILNFIQSNRLNVSQTEREAGIKAGRMDKWLRGFGRPKAEDSEKLQNWYDLNRKKDKPALEKVQKNAPVSDFKPIYGHEHSGASITNLTESNRILASAILRDAENRASLIKQNEELLLMVRQSESVQPKILEAFESRLSAFLAALSLVASGKRWKSATEAGAALHKFVYGENTGGREKDIRDGSGK